MLKFMEDILRYQGDLCWFGRDREKDRSRSSSLPTNVHSGHFMLRRFCSRWNAVLLITRLITDLLVFCIGFLQHLSGSLYCFWIDFFLPFRLFFKPFSCFTLKGPDRQRYTALKEYSSRRNTAAIKSRTKVAKIEEREREKIRKGNKVKNGRT